MLSPMSVFSSLSEVLARVVLVWPSRVHQKLRCLVKITKMAAVAWSIFLSLLENMTSTSLSEVCLSQV